MIPLNSSTEDTTTPLQKFTAALSGFGFACLAFFFAAIVLVPVTDSVSAALAVPDGLVAAIVFLELFGLTSIAGVAGVVVVARGIAAKQN